MGTLPQRTKKYPPKTITIKANDAFWKRLKIYAVRNNRRVRDIAKEAITLYLQSEQHPQIQEAEAADVA